MFEKCVIEDLLLYLFTFKIVFPVIPATSLIEFVFFCTLIVDKLRLTFGGQETNHYTQVSLCTNKNNTATLSFCCQIYLIGNDVEMRPYVRMCYSSSSIYFNWAIYAIEGALLSFGAFLAWETRKVIISSITVT